MAVTLVSGNRGTATEKTSDTSLTLTPTATLAAGNFALLFVVIDNVDSDEGQTTDISVTDSAGNSWSRVREQTEANTAAASGVTCAVFKSKLATALTTSSTITITVSAAVTAKGAGLSEWSVAAGKTLKTDDHNGANAVGTTSYSIALSGLPSADRVYVGMAAAEGEVDADCALDTAYTEIGFGSIGSGVAGAGPTNVRARVGTRTVAASTGDTFDATGLGAADRATILIALEEVTDVQTVSPSGLTRTRAIGTATITGTRRGLVSWAQFETPALTVLLIGPSGVVHSRAFGTARIVSEVEPASVAHARAIGAATVVRGSVTVAPGSVVHSRAFGLHVVSVIGIFPGSIVHGRAIGTALIVLRILPSGVVHGRAIGTTNLLYAQALALLAVLHNRSIVAPTVLGGIISVAPPAVVHTRVIGVASLSQTIRAIGVARTRTVGTPNVGKLIVPSSVVHTRAIGTPELQTGRRGIVSWAQFETPAAGITNLQPLSIIHTRAIGTATVLGGSLVLVPPSLVRVRAFGLPIVGTAPRIAAAGFMFLWGDVDAGVIAPTSITHNRSIGTPLLRIPVVTSSILHTRAIGTAKLNQKIVLGAIAHTRALGSPSVFLVLFTTAIVRTRSIGVAALGRGSIAVVSTSVVHARAIGTHVVTNLSTIQTVTPPSILHPRNITGPVILKDGVAPDTGQQRVATMEWGIDHMDDDAKVEI